MHLDSTLFFCAVGLAFVMEGLLWALFPRAMRRAIIEITTMPSGRLRRLGLAALGLGLFFVWLGRS